MSYTHLTCHSYVGAIMPSAALLGVIEVMQVPTAMALMNWHVGLVEREETRDLCLSIM